MPVLVVEDDPFLRLVEVVLDPRVSAERVAAFADFFSHELPDFEGWRQRVRMAAPNLVPSEVRLVSDLDLAGADAAVVESLVVGQAELASADRLRVVHKYGVVTRNIDLAACSARGVRVCTLRRRANIACAEHTFGMLLSLTRQIHRLNGQISAERLTALGYSPRPFDARHAPGSNWGRVAGLKVLYGSTLGIIGLGEIGREIARRALAFDMRVLYTQRTRLDGTAEQRLGVEYAPLDDLLARSDWVVPQLPSSPSTRGLLDRARLARMKPGACLVNVSRADVVDRAALLDALASGHLGGLGLDPQYAEPAPPDDPLLEFEHVVLTPRVAAQPRFNALDDIDDLITGLARALRAAAD
jgi:phosphoglycerate dehydrogenase-like enzyme